MFADQPLVSVIVPVYNVEKYLVDCVESIIHQSYKNIEVVLVDDGSKDNSGKICDELEGRYLVRVFHKANGGVSSARNYGIGKAQGKYVTFVDSDDTITEDCIYKLVQALHDNSFDFAGMRERSFLNEKNDIGIKIPEMHDKMLKYLSCDAYSVHACMYRMDILKSKDIHFREDMTCSEDALFNREYFCYCNSLYLIADKIYEYNSDNTGSLSHKGHDRYALYFIEKLRALSVLCDQMGLQQEEKKTFLTSRALHGLRMSIKHYVTHWKDEEICLKLVGECIAKFEPWLFCFSWKYSKQRLWWLLHKRWVTNKTVEKLIREQSFMNGVMKFRVMLIKCVKRGMSIVRIK